MPFAWLLNVMRELWFVASDVQGAGNRQIIRQLVVFDEDEKLLFFASLTQTSPMARSKRRDVNNIINEHRLCTSLVPSAAASSH